MCKGSPPGDPFTISKVLVCFDFKVQKRLCCFDYGCKITTFF